MNEMGNKMSDDNKFSIEELFNSLGRSIYKLEDLEYVEFVFRYKEPQISERIKGLITLKKQLIKMKEGYK